MIKQEEYRNETNQIYNSKETKLTDLDKSLVVVAKFGGSSVANSTQFKKVKDIVLSEDIQYKRDVVVISAIGKFDKNDSKVTDLLYLLHAHLKYNVPYTSIYEMIKERFYRIKNDLSLTLDLDKEFNEFEKLLTKDISEDFLVSRGEYITSKLMANYLGYTFVDAAELIKFNYDGTVNYQLTNNLVQKAYQEYHKIIVPGFYGSYPNGTIKTFIRGGSDITGAIVAAGLNALYYENWTDVSGILMTDPKIIKNALTIKEITYAELRELSYMGASVLHEHTVFPVRKLNIPIKILNTNSPHDCGTIITENCNDDELLITGIAGKKHFTSFTITKKSEVNKLNVITNALNVFSKFNVNVEHIPSSIDSFSVVVPSSDIVNNLYDIVTALKQISDIQEVSIDDDIALVAVVGRNMVYKPGISGRIFGIVGNNNINIKMIAQGSHEISIIVGVSNKDFEKTISVIYNDLVK